MIWPRSPAEAQKKKRRGQEGHSRRPSTGGGRRGVSSVGFLYQNRDEKEENYSRSHLTPTLSVSVSIRDR